MSACLSYTSIIANVMLRMCVWLNRGCNLGLFVQAQSQGSNWDPLQNGLGGYK